MSKQIKVNINGVVIEGLTLDDAIRVASRMGGKKIKTHTEGAFPTPELEPSVNKVGRNKGKKYAMWSTKALRTLVLNKHLTPTKLMEFPEISAGRNRRAVANQLGKVRTGKERVMGDKVWQVYKAIVIDKQEPNDTDGDNA